VCVRHEFPNRIIMVEYKAHQPAQAKKAAKKPAQAPGKPASAAVAAVPGPTPASDSTPRPAAPARKPEIGGPKGPEPTRYGDWEKGGRCIDF
jgi:hypothetical protein